MTATGEAIAAIVATTIAGTGIETATGTIIAATSPGRAAGRRMLAIVIVEFAAVLTSLQIR